MSPLTNAQHWAWNHGTAPATKAPSSNATPRRLIRSSEKKAVGLRGDGKVADLTTAVDGPAFGDAILDRIVHSSHSKEPLLIASRP